MCVLSLSYQNTDPYSFADNDATVCNNLGSFTGSEYPLVASSMFAVGNDEISSTTSPSSPSSPFLIAALGDTFGVVSVWVVSLEPCQSNNSLKGEGVGGDGKEEIVKSSVATFSSVASYQAHCMGANDVHACLLGPRLTLTLSNPSPN